MIKTIFCNSAGEARDAIANLIRKGYDVFRGQVYPWPLTPALFRVPKEDQNKCAEEVLEFEEWCQRQAPLNGYQYEGIHFVAIAQHYGLKTHLLDLTYSPEIAFFFATHNPTQQSESSPVVYCWRLDHLLHSQAVTVVDIEVDNLWRLKAQEGLFVACPEGTSLESASIDRVEIKFPVSSPLTTLRLEDVYPSQKSPLELILDHRFFERQVRPAVTTLMEHSKVVISPKTQPYANAFKGRIHIDDAKTKDITRVWHKVAPIPYDRINNLRKPVELRHDSLKGANEIAEVVVATFENGSCYPVFAVNIWNDEWRNVLSSVALNAVFDGIAAFPYSTTDRRVCLANCLRVLLILLSFRNDDDEESRYDKLRQSVEEAIGPTGLVDFNVPGGLPDSAYLSRAALFTAIDPSAVTSLRPYFRRRVEDNPFDLLMFSVDPRHTLTIQGAIRLFAADAIPAQFALKLTDFLWKKETRHTFRLLVDPWSLQHLRSSAYKDIAFQYDVELDRTLYLFADMTRTDIEQEVLFAGPLAQTGVTFRLRLHGFRKASLENRCAVMMPPTRNAAGRFVPTEVIPEAELPSAINLLQQFVNCGGLSVLEVSTLVNLGQPRPMTSLGDPPLGGFEVWIMCRGELEQFFNDRHYAYPAFEHFLHDRATSNDRLDEFLGSHDVAP